ncbi:unnamed protein product [Medioppia subpectinata]|uniref:Mon2/Sec7/BIG1-like HDS domain-containing protein n=1 Tax=Medioppia subpectinata TaxID=1979941 RepID=A0A7R9PTT3_9ACAR|nr:unnamed protein product [Medioppia subpectinata]CAG2100991.1 unnamed protein product [Medioppia subpectinata]
MTEEEFISDILNSGILVYISGHWLAELYQSVLADNLLGNAGYECKDELNVSLINILTDMDGLGSCEPGAQQLSDYRRLEKAVTNHIVSERDTESSAAHKLVRRLLTAFWDSILGCLGIVFRGDFSHKSGELKASVAFNNLLGSDAKAIMNRKMMITSTLDGLQIAAKLCIQLGLQSRCDKVVLSCGLEIGSHCSACWRYVFKCCQYIMQLEHNYFTSRHSSLLTSTRTSLCSLIKSSPKQCELYYNCETTLESTSMPGINEFEEINTETCINNLIAETTSQNNDSILKDKQLERVIDILSHLVDLLFEDAANKLNLRSLNGFLTQLCVCSGEQLSLLSKTESTSNCYSGKSLLLFRLSDVILRTARSGRPVLHFIKCWSSVSSHLVEAATHWDHFVAKKSISTIHDIINVFLSTHNELPHFHFNEALFKPFENLLLLELCDTDVQELIISSICEFVEGTTEDIRSGWRSLFGALRGIRLPQVCPQTKSCDSQELEVERVRQLGVILDIFEAFLHTDNLQVFANAAVDCLLCLLKLVQNPQTIANEMSINDETPKSLDLCLISLKYLHQFSSMLRSMYEMPACPLFSSHKLSHTIRIIDTTHLMSKTGVAPHLPIVITLDRMDKPNKILNIWFLLIDEYLRSINKCNPKHVNTAVEMLFQWLNCLIEIPANQIFLLESQRNIADMDSKYRTYGDNHSNPIRDNRSFVFVINDGQNTFTVLVIQLTSHWLILQIISSLLLTGIQPVMPNVDKLVHPMDNHSKPKSNVGECSDDSVKENGVEMYGLATESKMNQMMAQYKKYKVQHSPIPPIPPTPPNPTTTTPSTPTLSHIPNTIDANNTNTINDKTRSLEMIQHQKHIHLMDSQAFQILWSEIISMAIELHVSLPSHQFKQLMTSLLPAIQQLTVYCNDNRLRHTISLWITKVVDIHVIDQ